MSTAPETPTAPQGLRPGEPAWEIARLFPVQGMWSESDYFELQTDRGVEFSHGFVEILPMPTILHQRIAGFVYDALRAFVHGVGSRRSALHRRAGAPLAGQVSRA